MKDKALNAKGERMLELLAQGASNRLVAKRMGHTEGTMRVYLHNLYKKIGVGNKTEAVIWYLGREQSRHQRRGPAQPEPVAAAAAAPERSGDLLGDMAVEEGLYAALGAMSRFVGPFGKIWELGMRLNGQQVGPELALRRDRARQLWNALLKGDWSYGKRLFDDDQGAALAIDSPPDAVLLVALLMAGGYSNAADRLAARITDRRKGAAAASAREAGLIEGLRDALYDDGPAATAALAKVAAEKSAPAILKQVAIALLFHAHAARRDHERARQSAQALWAEAEAARQQLEAMGERPFGAGAAQSSRAAAKPATASRPKAAVTR